VYEQLVVLGFPAAHLLTGISFEIAVAEELRQKQLLLQEVSDHS
jgi:hypothetical protein